MPLPLPYASTSVLGTWMATDFSSSHVADGPVSSIPSGFGSGDSNRLTKAAFNLGATYLGNGTSVGSATPWVPADGDRLSWAVCFEVNRTT